MLMMAGSTVPGIDDFTITSENLMFNENTEIGAFFVFEVPIVDDMLVEDQEDIVILATIDGNRGHFVGGGTMTTVQINIIENDRM